MKPTGLTKPDTELEKALLREALPLPSRKQPRGQETVESRPCLLPLRGCEQPEVRGKKLKVIHPLPQPGSELLAAPQLLGGPLMDTNPEGGPAQVHRACLCDPTPLQSGRGKSFSLRPLPGARTRERNSATTLSENLRRQYSFLLRGGLRNHTSLGWNPHRHVLSTLALGK